MAGNYGDSWRFVPDYEKLGERLEAARNSYGLSREKVVDILYEIGIKATTQSIWNWEKAKKHITLEHLFVLACIYDVEVSYLLTGLDNYVPGRK